MLVLNQKAGPNLDFTLRLRSTTNTFPLDHHPDLIKRKMKHVNIYTASAYTG